MLDSVNIRFVVGYGPDFTAVPKNIKHAILMLVSHWYINRENVAVGVVPERIQDTIDALISASDHGGYT